MLKLPRPGYLLSLSMVFILFSCSGGAGDRSETLFEELSPEQTGVDFENLLYPTEEFNMYIFRNFYNGGGVAVGDVTGDGFPDLFFTGNMVSNRLYVNQGDFRFIDVTVSAGLNSDGIWSTGASMADVNGDGLLDLYVTVSGEPGGEDRHNRLYINNGDTSELKDGSGLTFTESSQEYGLRDENLSTHGLFFDYDLDGDLDLYLVANSFQNIGSFQGFTGEQREIPDVQGASKLYRNDGGTFTDVTVDAGIYSSLIGFGLSASAGDLNRDGYPDLYVANDFFERDYLYINNGDGTFTESLTNFIRSLSFSSMGSDIADINNDGWPEIFVTDMFPYDESRLKSKMTLETWEEYRENVDKGFHHKFTRNTLQLNNGDQGGFSEIGRLSGVHATDWSWATLIADLDNSGFSDIFVANGIYKDLLDQDYIEQVANPRVIGQMVQSGEENVIMNLMDAMSSTPVPNRAFSNRNGVEFDESTAEWGLERPGFSTGAAWADLNADGALELILNDVNGGARIYRNKAPELRDGHNWLRIHLQGEGGNRFGIGAQLHVWAGDRYWFREHYLQKGFQSSMEPGLHVGLGEIQSVDSLIVRWPDGSAQALYDIELPRMLEVQQSDAERNQIQVPMRGPVHLPGDKDQPVSGIVSSNENNDTLLEEVHVNGLSDFIHRQYGFDEFSREPLLNFMRSHEGPALCKGDVNGDNLEDLYFGGGRDQAGRLLIQQPNGEFIAQQPDLFSEDASSEDTDCAFFDATGNGVDDLYVVSGGNSFSSSSSALLDRFYLNDGLGNFTNSGQFLPTTRGYEPGSVVAPHDFTNDGIEDLFVGIRLKPFATGIPVNGYLLEGDGEGGFTDVTEQMAPDLIGMGMITDALWSDLTGDGHSELVITGEWMPVRVFRNTGEQFEEITADLGLGETRGWWNALAAADLDGDGFMDIVAGNHGRNSIFKVDAEHSVRMWAGDISGNGLVEQVIATSSDGEYYPTALRPEMVEAIPSLGSRYPTYEEFAGTPVEELLTGEELGRTQIFDVDILESMIFRNRNGEEMQMEPLPLRAQLAPVFAIHASDLNGDGVSDILTGGNLFDVKPHIGPYDASKGAWITPGQNGFVSHSPSESGIYVPGESRNILSITINGIPHVIWARSGDTPVIYRVN
ncbi:MAG: VCBS repeat-containing protein [Balneolaceae bacterium]|nr:VCBS repeat-containing protein [Balneolaceae bacterium]